MNFLLLSGSFHRRSYSQALLRFVAEQLPEHQHVSPNLLHLPFYSEDLAGEQRPQVIVDFLQQVSAADALIICSPEYNHSIPAVLKNAIDWASRPAFKSPLKDKPVTFITQANSPVGGARAQGFGVGVGAGTGARIGSGRAMGGGSVTGGAGGGITGCTAGGTSKRSGEESEPTEKDFMSASENTGL